MKKMNDFVLKNGKLVVGDALENEVRDILIAKKGHVKFFPNIGVGIDDFVDEKTGDKHLFSLVSAELKKDGKRLKKAQTIGETYITTVERIA